MLVNEAIIELFKKFKLNQESLNFWNSKISGFSEKQCTDVLNLFLINKDGLIKFKDKQKIRLKNYQDKIKEINKKIDKYYSSFEDEEKTNFNGNDFLKNKLGGISYLVSFNDVVYGKENRLVGLRGPTLSESSKSDEVPTESAEGQNESIDDSKGAIDGLLNRGQKSLGNIGDYLSGKNGLTPEQITELKKGAESLRQELEKTGDSANLDYYLVGLTELALSAIQLREQGQQLSKDLLVPEEVQLLIDGKPIEIILASGALFVLGLTPAGKGWRFWKKATKGKPSSGVTFDGEDWETAMNKGNYKLKKPKEREKTDTTHAEEQREIGDILPENMATLSRAEFLKHFNDFTYHWEQVSKKLPDLPKDRKKEAVEVIFMGQKGHMEAIFKWVEGNPELAEMLKDEILDYILDVKIASRTNRSGHYTNIINIFKEINDLLN